MNRFEKALKEFKDVTKHDYDVGGDAREAIEEALTACASGVFKIKPLVWEENEDTGIISSKTIFGIIAISRNDLDGWYRIFSGGVGGNYKTFDEAKSAVETWHRNKLMEALEEVK